MQNEPISQEILDESLQKMCLALAGVLITAMVVTGTSFLVISRRLGVQEKTVRSWIRQLLDGGRGTLPKLKSISDMAFAMGVEIKLDASRRSAPLSYSVQQEIADQAQADVAAGAEF